MKDMPMLKYENVQLFFRISSSCGSSRPYLVVAREVEELMRKKG